MQLNLCKITSKYLDMKNLIGLLKSKIEKAWPRKCPRNDFEKLQPENLRLKEQIETLKLALAKFLVNPNKLNMLIGSQMVGYSKERLGYRRLKQCFRLQASEGQMIIKKN